MKSLIIFVAIITLSSCANNKEEGPVPIIPSANPITYNNATKKIFDTRCIACHAPNLSQAGFPLTTYQEVTFSNYGSVGGLIENRVLIQQNMPPSASWTGQLTQGEMDTLQLWINQGSPE